MRKYRFAGLTLTSKIGLSSDNPIISPCFYDWLLANNIGIIFTPTITRNTLPEEKDKRYAKISIAELTEEDYIIITRPLSMSFDLFTNLLLQRLKDSSKNNSSIPIVASIAGKRLSDFADIIEKLEESGIFSAIELDLISTQILLGSRRGLFEYSIDLIDEIISITKMTVISKIPVSMALSKDTLPDLLKTDVKGIVISPHPIYSIGSHIFRVHSTALSRININILAKVLTQFEEIDVAYVDDALEIEKKEKPFIYKIFNLLLYDVSFLLNFKKSIRSYTRGFQEFPIIWPHLRKGFKLVVDPRYVKQCSKICPYDAIPFKEEEELIEVTDKCDFCGLCVSICPKNSVKKARVFTPL